MIPYINMKNPTTPAGITGQIIHAPHSEVSDHPDWSMCPTLEESAGVGPEALEQWEALRDSVALHGVIEPAKAVRRPDGNGWWVPDGRSRRAASSHAGQTTFPVIEIRKEEAQTMFLESLKRRQTPSHTRTYLLCKRHEETLCAQTQGGDRRKSLSGDLRKGPTQKDIAKACGVHTDTVKMCVKALKHFREFPESRAKLEPKVLAGLMEPSHVLPGVKGFDPENPPSLESSYASSRKTLSSFFNKAKNYLDWSDEERAAFHKEALKSAEGTPVIVLDTLRDILNQAIPVALKKQEFWPEAANGSAGHE